MTEKPPPNPADHAEQFAHEWRDKLEEYCTVRMQELGIPDHMNGEPDYDGDGKWHAFDPAGRTGGSNTTGVVTDSGVLNPDLLDGEKGAPLGPECAFGTVLMPSFHMNTRSYASERISVRSRRPPRPTLPSARAADCAGQGHGDHPACFACSRSSSSASKPSFVSR